MQNIKKYFMTLALLITAVGGAWAQSSLNVVELKVPAEWETDQSNLTTGDLPGFKTSTKEEAKAWTGAPKTGGAMFIYAFDGENTQYVFFYDGVFNYEENSPFQKNVVFSNSKYDVKFYYTAEPEPTEWSLTPDETGKKWTLDKMPASNVELQVEYYAESNLFLGKEALADKTNIAVKNGETTVEFDDDGKSTATVTEGNTVTAKFTGKKVLGMKVEKKGGAVENAYQKWDADQKKMVATEIPTTAIKVENANAGVEWQAGTYVVEGDVTINGSITLNGEVNLIIKDGAKLTAQKISGASKNLSIYGQANQTGQLVVDNSGDDAISSIKTLEVHSAKVKATSSGNNRGGFYYTETINVYGGSVDAENTAADGGYGIAMKAGGFMNIFGGEVKAVGKGDNSRSNGINGGDPVEIGTVTVYGGKLWAENADDKALRYVNLQKGTGFTGKIETSNDNSAWAEYTDAETPTTKYVRVGY